MGDKLDFDEFVFKAVNNKETNRKKRFREDENENAKGHPAQNIPNTREAIFFRRAAPPSPA